MHKEGNDAKDAGFSKFRDAIQSPASKSPISLNNKNNESNEIDGEYFQKLLKWSGMI